MYCTPAELMARRFAALSAVGGGDVASFARGGGARSAKGGKSKSAKGKGVTQGSKGGLCCKTDGGKFAPGNNYGSAGGARSSQKAAAKRVGDRLAAKSQGAKATAEAKRAIRAEVLAVRRGADPASIGAAQGKRSAALKAREGVSRDKAALDKRQAKNAAVRASRAAKKEAGKAEAGKAGQKAANDRMVVRSKEATSKAAEQIKGRPKLKPGGAYSHDIRAARSTLRPGDQFRIDTGRGTESGTITKVNRSTVDYEKNYMGSPTKYRTKIEDFRGGYLQRGNKIHKITGSERTPLTAKQQAKSDESRRRSLESSGRPFSTSPPPPTRSEKKEAKATRQAEKIAARWSASPVKPPIAKATSRATPERRAKADLLKIQRSRVAGARAQAAARGAAAKAEAGKAGQKAANDRMVDKSKLAAEVKKAEVRLREFKARRVAAGLAPTPPPATITLKAKATPKAKSTEPKLSARARRQIEQDRVIAERVAKARQEVRSSRDERAARALTRAGERLGDAKASTPRSGQPKALAKDSRGRTTPEVAARRAAQAVQIKRARKVVRGLDKNQQAKLAEQKALAERRRAERPKFDFEKSNRKAEAASLKRMTDKSLVASGKAGAANAAARLAPASAERNAVGYTRKGELALADRAEASVRSVTPVKPPPPEITRRPIGDPVRLKAESSKMDEAFSAAPGGGRDNFVSIAALQKSMPHLSRNEFVAVVNKGRDDGKYSLDSHEGLNRPLSKLEKDAAFIEGNSTLVYISRRDR